MERRNVTCGAKTGLLFLKDCGRIPIAECAQCSRPICREHSIASENGTICPECASGNKKTARKQRAGHACDRNRYYHRYGYHPYYYGHHHYYSDRDYRTFDDAEQIDVDAADAADDMMADDATSAFMES